MWDDLPTGRGCGPLCARTPAIHRGVELSATRYMRKTCLGVKVCVILLGVQNAFLAFLPGLRAKSQ